jgi:hypothetical protein
MTTSFAGQNGGDEQPHRVDIETTAARAVLLRQEARMEREAAQRPPELAVEMHQLVQQGVGDEMPDRERIRVEHFLATARAVAARERLPTARAPRNGVLGDSRYHLSPLS